MGTILLLAWQEYIKQLSRRPVRTKALSAAVIAGLSDVLAQSLGKQSRDWKRTKKIALFGLIWSGPAAHYWQAFLNHMFGGKQDMGTAIKKVLVDQLTYGPLCNLLFMSYMTLIVEGRTLPHLRGRIFRDFPTVQLQGWKIWPLASLINYWLVPLQFRVLFVNLVALCWTMYLITRSKKAVKKDAAQQE